jgi:hypothetical protein
MDAREYARLTDAIAAARTPEELAAVRELVRRAEMRPLERRALERLVRARADAMRVGRTAPFAERGELTRPEHPAPSLRYELLEGEEWRGDYPTRRAAMADAERIAAGRGQTLNWVRLSETAAMGMPHPAEEQPPFTVRPRPGTTRGPESPGLPSDG